MYAVRKYKYIYDYILTKVLALMLNKTIYLVCKYEYINMITF